MNWFRTSRIDPPGSDFIGRVKAFEDAGIPLCVIDIAEIVQCNISALKKPEERGAVVRPWGQTRAAGVPGREAPPVRWVQ